MSTRGRWSGATRATSRAGTPGSSTRASPMARPRRARRRSSGSTPRQSAGSSARRAEALGRGEEPSCGRARFEEAKNLVVAGRHVEGLAIAIQLARGAAPTRADRFRANIDVARLAMGAGALDVARPILEGLVATATAHALETWDPGAFAREALCSPLSRAAARRAGPSEGVRGALPARSCAPRFARQGAACRWTARRVRSPSAVRRRAGRRRSRSPLRPRNRSMDNPLQSAQPSGSRAAAARAAAATARAEDHSEFRLRGRRLLSRVARFEALRRTTNRV